MNDSGSQGTRRAVARAIEPSRSSPSDVRELGQAEERPSFLRTKSAAPVAFPSQDVVTTTGVKVATVTLADAFVEVQPFSLETLAAATLLQTAIDTELLRSGHGRLLIDAVDMAIAPKEVNDAMWSWAHSHPLLKMIAVVNRSPVMSVAVRMRAVAQRQRLGAFGDRSEAAAWLRKG